MFSPPTPFFSNRVRRRKVQDYINIFRICNKYELDRSNKKCCTVQI